MLTEQTFEALSRRRALQTGGGFAALSALFLSRRASRVQAQEATPVATPAECAPTTPEENKAIVNQYNSAWAERSSSLLADVLAPDYLHHWGFSTDSTGADVMIERLDELFQAFPDVTVTVDMMLAENDLVAEHWTFTGTQTGEFRGVPPTTVTTTYTGINIFRIECGKIAEGWSEADHLGRLIQAGVITDDELGSVGTPTP
jgi:steroid delta-isomerase-like uncharacterized protein